MKVIIILLCLLFSQAIYAQNQENNFVDVLRDHEQSQVNSQYKYIIERKSPSISFLSSLVVPGGGHFYNGNYVKAGVFFLARASVIAVIIAKADDQIIKTDPGETDSKLNTVSWAIPLYVTGISLVLLDSLMASTDANKYNHKLRDKYNLTLSTTSKGFTLAYNF